MVTTTVLRTETHLCIALQEKANLKTGLKGNELDTPRCGRVSESSNESKPSCAYFKWKVTGTDPEKLCLFYLFIHMWLQLVVRRGCFRSVWKSKAKVRLETGCRSANEERDGAAGWKAWDATRTWILSLCATMTGSPTSRSRPQRVPDHEEMWAELDKWCVMV